MISPEKPGKLCRQFRAGADSFETYAAVKQTSKMECNIFCSMGPMVEGRDVVEEKTCLNMEIQGE